MSFTEEQTLTKEQLLAELETDFQNAQSGLVKMAKSFDTRACYTVGLVYYRNENYPKALAWYRISANGNNAQAISILGTMYFNGEGVTRSYPTALGWLLKAAEMGQTTSVGYQLGMMFEHGYGVPMDKRKALLWYYQWDKYSPPVNRLKMKGYHLAPSEKEWSPRDVLKDTHIFLKNERDKRNTELRIAILEKERATMSDEIKYLQVVNDSLKHENTKTNDDIRVLKESNLSLKQENIKIRKEIQKLKDSCYLFQQALQQLQSRVIMPTQLQSTINKMDSVVKHMEKSSQNSDSNKTRNTDDLRNNDNMNDFCYDSASDNECDNNK